MHFSSWEKIGFGLLIAAWAAFGSNLVGNMLLKAEPLEEAAYQIAVAEPEEGEAKATEDAAEDAIGMLAMADAEKGAKVFKKCQACHSTDEGAKHKVGPNLWDIVGRAKGSAAGFGFSGAITGLGGEWDYADLDQFLANPKAYAPGTKMSYAGLKKASDRAALIAYLRSLSASPKPLP